MTSRYMSAAARRSRRYNIAGIALVGSVLLAGASLVRLGVAVDRANGLTVAQSLASAGIGRAEAPARPASFIGRCGGRMMAGATESSFPAGCAWIEPIRDADATPASDSGCADYVATIRHAERLAGERPAKTDSALCSAYRADVEKQARRWADIKRLESSL